MPKGLTPKQSMQKRRDAYEEEFLRLSGVDKPSLPTNKIGEPPINNKLGNYLSGKVNELALAVQAAKNADALGDLNARMDKIDTNRENEAQRSTRARKYMRNQ